jgi:ubiquinone/menaquinone biosynthesis C-methylase UbiE
MRWLRKPSGDPLAVTMPGVKLGDRLLVIGAADTALIVALASKAGLTGRACVLDESDDVRARAAAAIEREGVLIESFSSPLTALPFDPASFDIVVMRNVLSTITEDRRAPVVTEVERVVRPGGRSVTIDDVRRGGLGGLLGGARSAVDGQGLSALLSASGFRAVRVLAEREGLLFVEGVKPGLGPG